MLRNSGLIRRAFMRRAQRRYFHEESREDFRTLPVPRLLGSDPRFGMDMTGAPGYQIEPDDDIPLATNQKLADFAARHARLSSTQVEHADGYIWIGSVLYPPGSNSDLDVTFSWEVSTDEKIDFDCDIECIADVKNRDDADSPVVETKRRYTGGQARRIRKERARSGLKRPTRTRNQRPIRKPENGVPAEEDQ